MLKAALIFKGIMIEWVTVKGYDETFEDDLWAESRHQVFRKVQDHTHSAMLHFYSPTLPELAVKFFMVRDPYPIRMPSPCNEKQILMISVFIVSGLVAQLFETFQRTM